MSDEILTTNNSHAIVEIVAAFVTRRSDRDGEIRIIRHPNSGLHLPAGIVKPGEQHEDAAHREFAEETGITQALSILKTRPELHPFQDDWLKRWYPKLMRIVER